MRNITQRAVTYSLLAYIRDKEDLIEGPVDVFVPIIKRVLSKLNERGTFSGENISEIKELALELHDIDFPFPVLRSILKKISLDVNNNNNKCFSLFEDDSFQIKNYSFTEFEETIANHKKSINDLERLFEDFCDSCSEAVKEKKSILSFIESNKLSLSRYLANKGAEQAANDYTVEAQFVDYFRQIPAVYDTIRKIYLGSILSGYIEYKTENVTVNVQLVFDTNFLLGALDLNTPQSTDTCLKLLEVGKNQGCQLFVLQDTLDEATALLRAKAEYFQTAFFQKKVNPEDVYNACDRRRLNRADLERIADNLNKLVSELGINIIHDTRKYKNLAKNSKEYQFFKQYRNSDKAALHDALAIHYVRVKRGKKIRSFENVNCWFVNNSISRTKYDDENPLTKHAQFEYQPEIIKADDYLNIVWLSSPQINDQVNMDTMADIGLTSLISLTLAESAPKASIIQELDDNIHKYANDGSLSDTDIVRVATRITSKQLTDIEGLNDLAKTDKESFIKRLTHEARKQEATEKARIKKVETRLDAITKDYHTKHTRLEKKVDVLESERKKLLDGDSQKDKEIDRLKGKLRDEENRKRDEKRITYLNKKLWEWRRRTWIELSVWVLLVLIPIIYVLIHAEWSTSEVLHLVLNLASNQTIATVLSVLGLIFSGITGKTLFNKYRDHSNIEAYKRSISIPEHLKPIKNSEYL